MKPIIRLLGRWSGASAMLVIALAACSDVTTPNGVTGPRGRATRDLLPSVQPKVVAGFHHSCVLRFSGTVNCYGSQGDPYIAKLVQAPGDVFVNLAASNATESDCAVRRSGSIQCWGDNFNSQAPASVSPANEWFAAAAVTETHGCGLRTDGVIQCWGTNGSGQADFQYIVAGGGFVGVSVATNSTCGLRADGVINCYGDNTFGQAPEEVTATSGHHFIDFSISYDFGCGLREDGVAECWGASDEGQAPASKSAAAGHFVQISTGDSHTCALRDDGAVECWGENYDNQGPALQTSAVSTFAEVSAGANHTCAMRPSGSVECWGESLPLYDHVFSDGRSVNATAVSASQISLTLEPTPGATSQQIQRRSKTAAGWTPWLSIADTTGDLGGYVDTLAVPATTYQYRARSCNGSCSPYVVSNTVIARSFSPPSPTVVNATPADRTTILVYWLDAADETSYLIERRQKDGATWSGWRLLATRPANFGGMGDENLTTGKRYQYRVTACNTAGCSAPAASNQVVAELPPDNVGTFSASVASTSQIDLAWNDTPRAYTYQVQRQVWDYTNRLWVASTTWSETSPSTGVSDVAGIDASRGYRYRVRACNVAGCSTYTTWSVANTGSLPLAASPLQGSGTPSAFPGLVVFGWSDTNADEIGYVVERRYDSGGGWGPWEFQALTDPDVLAYEDHSPPSGLIQYRVKACNTVGCSAYKTSRVIAY